MCGNTYQATHDWVLIAFVQKNIGSCRIFEPVDLSQILKLNEINDSGDCTSLRIPNTSSRGNVSFYRHIHVQLDSVIPVKLLSGYHLN